MQLATPVPLLSQVALADSGTTIMIRLLQDLSHPRKRLATSSPGHIPAGTPMRALTHKAQMFLSTPECSHPVRKSERQKMRRPDGFVRRDLRTIEGLVRGRKCSAWQYHHLARRSAVGNLGRRSIFGLHCVESCYGAKARECDRKHCFFHHLLPINLRSSALYVVRARRIAVLVWAMLRMLDTTHMCR